MEGKLILNFTIIIPHYNIPDLLKRCLDSIPQRQDVEILVVDNNSTEDNRRAAIAICGQFPRVKYIQDEIGNGAGHARNIGLDNAKGKWLLFADSDDFFVGNLTEVLNQNVDSTEDIIFFRKRSVYSDDVTKEAKRSKWSDKFFDDYIKTNNELDFRRGYYAPWGKLIRRQLVVDNNIRFDETPFSNDAYFSVHSACLAGSIGVRNYPLYVVTIRNGSLMSNYCRKPAELEVRFNVCIRVQEFLSDNNYPMDLGYLSRMTYLLYKRNPSEFNSYFGRLKKLNISLRSALQEAIRNFRKQSYKTILKIIWLWLMLNLRY